MGTFNSTPLSTLPNVYNRLFDLIKKYQFTLDIKNDNFQLTPQQILEIRNDALNRYIKPITTSFQSYATLGQQGVQAISDAESMWTSVANFSSVGWAESNKAQQ